jgi:hypothetical protein
VKEHKRVDEKTIDFVSSWKKVKTQKPNRRRRWSIRATIPFWNKTDTVSSKNCKSIGKSV